jgi:hypothetical protein
LSPGSQTIQDYFSSREERVVNKRDEAVGELKGIEENKRW